MIDMITISWAIIVLVALVLKGMLNDYSSMQDNNRWFMGLTFIGLVNLGLVCFAIWV